ncbi:MAG TPA: hypothetical protein VM890_06530 [Longimicrobium sp.]|jgi:hypothetical protein|nr:hypothetical protein [Longimicrobium sp.]
MRKLKLEIDELQVETFATATAGVEHGTVEGNATFLGTGACRSCVDMSRCIETCGDTCDNSLDYCTCACTDDCTHVGPGCYHISQNGSCPCYLDPY